MSCLGMDCRDCKFADWQRTANGRLHPSGDGRCTAPVKIQTLPKSMYWIGTAPTPSGGYISRKELERYAGCQRWMDKDSGC